MSNIIKTTQSISKSFQNLKLVTVRADQIFHDPDHPRLITDEQVSRAALLIEQTGFRLPIIVDTTGYIIIGGEWYEGGKQCGLTEFQVVYINTLNKGQISALRVGYPKILELGEWDIKKLASDIEIMHEFKIDTRVTGFELAEIDGFLSKSKPSQSEIVDNAIPAIDLNKPAVSKLEDVWMLGRHRLINGDALDGVYYTKLLSGTRVHAMITDPPYDLPISGVVGGLGKVKHREFVQASGEMGEEKFTKFLTGFLLAATEQLVSGGLAYCFIDWRHQFEMLTAQRNAKLQLQNCVVWVKNNGGMGSFYRSQHELCFLFKKGKASHTNNVQLGKHGRYRTNVWEYAGVNSFRKGRMDELSMHPTVKPVAMIADAILDCTHWDENVLDPFAGSGTIFIACEKTNRIGYGIELDPLYVDTAIRRWQDYTGLEAVHAETGLTFNELEQQSSYSAKA